MLAEKVAEALQKQIANEGSASSSYLGMASWCEVQGLRGCAEFLYEQSSEEREHMMKIIRYLNQAGGHAEIPALKEPLNKYKTVSEVFTAALKQEQGVTQSINKIVEMSLDEKDFVSFNFLQWFVGEQLEEENLFRCILDIIKISGSDPRSLLLIDNEIAKIRAAKSGS